MKLRHALLISGAIVAAALGAAQADITYTQGSGTTIFDFTCFTTKHCSAHVPVNSAGTEIATSGNPLRTDPTGSTTQPVSAASLPLPTGASTSANQTSQLTQETATAAALGTTADSVCGSSTGTCSIAALIKFLNNAAIAATPACSAAPCLTTIGNVGVDPTSGKVAPAFVNLALPATTTTQIIALSGSTKTYITSLKMMSSGAVNLTLKYGTGANCGTGTTTLEGPYPLAAQAGATAGAGTGAVIIVPAGQAVCVTTDATMTGFVSMTYQQF